MNNTDLSQTLMYAQILARSDNPLDHVIAREMIANLIKADEEE